jgi:putative heme-binding domain-containing protein
VSGGFDDRLAERLLNSSHEYVRAWTVRLLGDERTVSPELQSWLVRIARDDSSLVVRSQLACTAKRLPAEARIPIVAELLRHSEDVDDVHIPLLLWWAIEDKAISEASIVLGLCESPDVWKLPLVRQFIVQRLARRLTAEGTDTGFAANAKLLTLVPDDEGRQLVLKGMVEGCSSHRFKTIPKPLQAPLANLLTQQPSNTLVIKLALPLGGPTSAATRAIEDPAHPTAERLAIIRALGETRSTAAVDPLLRLFADGQPAQFQAAALAALAHFDDMRIAAKVRSAYSILKPSAKSPAIDVLCSRSTGARVLVAAVEKNEIDPKAVTLAQVQQLFEHDDEELHRLATKIWGRVQPATPLQLQGRISAVSQLARRRKGDVARGLTIFEKTCANCHKLHGKGTQIGPNLTGAERKDVLKLIRNIVDPSSEVRPQYISYIAVTESGRVITGLLADSNAKSITLLEPKNKRVVLSRADLEELRESPVSLMPEKLLDQLSDQQIRDLLSYIQSNGPASN